MNSYSKKVLLILAAYFFSYQAFSQCTTSGTISIGATGTYPTLTAAANALRANGLSGPVILELQSSYSSTAETFPIDFSGINCVDFFKTITIRPQTGATGLVIATASQYTFDLNNTAHLIIDGRPGGAGTAIGLTITNTHNIGAAVRFINNASNDTLRYLNLRGAASNGVPQAVTTYDTVGVVKFAMSTSGVGCDSNLIYQCNVFDAATTTPGTLIYAEGTAGKINDHNSILNCNLYNFYQQSNNSYGIYLKEYNSQWTISNNSFYQTAARTYILNTYTPDIFCLKIMTSIYGGFIVDGNYLGGTQANAGGAAMNLAGNFMFTPMGLSSAYLPAFPSDVSGNVVTNFAASPSNNLATVAAINLGVAPASFYGDCHDNVVGSMTATGSIVFNAPGNSSTFIGIGGTVNNTIDPVYIRNNKIGGITLGGTNTSFWGINVGGSANVIVDTNNIGSPAVANSVLDNAGGYIYGIRVVNYSASGKLTLSRNVISNLTSGSTSFGATVSGIYTEGTASGRYLFEKNTINNLSAASTGTSATIGTVNGISLNLGGVPAINVRYNKIDRLSALSASSANYVYGIYYNSTSGAAGADSINANVISSFSTTSTGNVNMKGIHIDAGNSLVYNNAIRLGIDANGNAVSGNYTITGISENAGSNSILHNSVYIGGGNTTAGTANTYGFKSAVTSGTRIVANNIFYNARSAASGKNYAIFIPGTTPAPAGLYLNYNLYFANGLNGFLGRFNNTDYATMAAWAAATQLDNNSLFVDPNFLNMTGNLASLNYHLSAITPAESAGTATNTVVYDIDDETRTSLTPVDIGADAGLYSNVTIDNTPPAINFTPLPDAIDLSNRTLTAVISDAGTGVDTTGNLKPRIWYRRKSPNTSAWVSKAGTFISGTLNNGNYSFTIDYSLIAGTTAFADTIQYYVVAQDKATIPNVGSNAPAQHSSVNVQIAAPANPNNFEIHPQLIGDLFVGTGQPYTSLTNNGGVFFAINKWGLAGAVNIKITSDLLSESGNNFLKSDGLHGYNVQIVPATTGLKTISNNAYANQPLITFYFNAANITVDGAFNGSGKYLRFAFAADLTIYGSAGAAIDISLGCNNVIIRNCIVEGDGSGTSYMDGTIAIDGNANNIQIKDNIIRDLSNHILASGVPAFAIGINGAKKLSITGNTITNASQYLINATPFGDTLSIIGNQMYNTQSMGCNGFIKVYGNNGVIIKDNYLGGTAPNCSGGPMTVTTNVFRGIYIYENPSNTTDLTLSIQNNVIRNMLFPATPTNQSGVLNMIDVYGVAKSNIGDQSPNYIGDINDPNSIVLNPSMAVMELIGIRTMHGKNTIVANNVVAGIKVNSTNAYRSKIIGIGCPSESTVTGINTGTVNVYNNIVKNITANNQGPWYVNLWGIAFGDLEYQGPVHIHNNIVSNLSAKAVGADCLVEGIASTQSNTYTKTWIEQNRVWGLQNENTNGTINGISSWPASATTIIDNNQVAITNNSLTNTVRINGIKTYSVSFGAGATHNTIDYNSIYLGGAAASTDSSAAIFVHEDHNVATSAITALKNNLLYNGRTSPSGRHTALSVKSQGVAGQWPQGASDYNLMVVNDTLNTATLVTENGLRISQFKQLSGGDNNSYVALTSSLPATTFFKAVDTANLDINNSNPICWYVNGKGTPIDSIAVDFSNDPRSISISTGTTDIGADEFNTTTLPPPLEIYARHIPGGADTLVWAGRRIGIINWDNNGTLPTLGAVRWYTGTWPNDTTNGGTMSGARFMNNYLQIPATGGSNFKYNLTLNYDKAMLGHITVPSTMIINKREIGVNGSWKKIIPTTVDTVASALLVTGQTSFSEFTGTDLLAPLSNKVDDGTAAGGTFTGLTHQLYISPNPTTGNLTVTMMLTSTRHVSMGIIDASGRMIMHTPDESVSGLYKRTIDLHLLPAGAYILVVYLDDNILSDKIVVAK